MATNHIFDQEDPCFMFLDVIGVILKKLKRLNADSVILDLGDPILIDAKKCRE